MKSIINQISKIDNSVDLNVVIDAIRTQQKAIKAREIAKAKATFSVGDKVKIVTKGRVFTGTILKINRTKAICELDGKPGTYEVPLRMMEAI